MRRYTVAFYDYRTSELPLWQITVTADTPGAAVMQAFALRKPTENAPFFRWIEVREI